MPATREAIRKGWAVRQAKEKAQRAELSIQLRAQGIPEDWCVNGHDRTVVGVSAKRECRQCNRDRAVLRRTQVGRPRPKDGMEDEFGPVPQKRSNDAWVDRVVLQRWLAGEDFGRVLTNGEARALHLLEVLRA